MTTTTKNGSKGKGAAVKGKNGKGKASKPAVKNGKTPANKGKGKPTATAPRAVKEGLRKPQVQLLQALSKSKRPLSRSELASAAAPFDPTKVGDYCGPRPADRTAKAAARYPFPDLVSLKFVRVSFTRPATDGAKGKMQYEITAAGKAALQKALKEGK